MRNFSDMILAGLVAGLAIVPWGYAMPAAEISPPWCATAPVLDGVLGAEEWSAGTVVTGFTALTAADIPAPAPDVPVRAWLMRDGEWLYVGARVRHALSVRKTMLVARRDTSPPVDVDCLEIGFDPGNSLCQWYGIAVTPDNFLVDWRYWRDADTGRGSDLKWYLPLRSAVAVSDSEWCVEMALPLGYLMPEETQGRAGICLTARMVTPVFDPYGVEIATKTHVYGWGAAAPGWYWMPETFCRLAGLECATGADGFWPGLENAGIGGYQYAGGHRCYSVRGAVRNYGKRPGAVALCVRDVAVKGAAATVRLNLSVPGSASAKFEINVPVSSLDERSVWLEIAHADGGLIDRAFFCDPPELDLLNVRLERNYYTDEPSAAALYRLGLPTEDWPAIRLNVSDAGGRLLGSGRYTAEWTRVEFPITDWTTGMTAIVASCADGDGKLLASRALNVTKRPARPGKEWKIDHIRRCVLHDGEPFFPYGLLVNAAGRGPDNLREIAAAGFNCIMLWQGDYDAQSLRGSMDAAWSNNLFTILRVDELAGVHAGFTPKLPPGIANWPHGRWIGFTSLKTGFVKDRDKFTREQRNRIFGGAFSQAVPLIRGGLMALREHPALMGYESFDEPLRDHWFDQSFYGQALYDMIREIDGYRPVRVLWNYGLPAYEPKYTAWSDIHARDPYWIPPIRPPDDGGTDRFVPDRVARDAADLRARGRRDGKPIWLTPALEFWSGCHKRMLLPEEQRAQTYLALLYETTGLLYFIYPASHQATWNMMRRIGGELRELRHILLSSAPAHEVVYAGQTVDIVNGRMPDVHAALRRNAQDGSALMAVNSRPWPVHVRFNLSFAGAIGVAREYFSRRNHAFTDGQWQDVLEPLACRIYEIAAPPPVAGARITIEQEALRRDYVPEPLWPRSGRQGYVNIMPNPSFENAALPEFPDYWHIMATALPEHPAERTGGARPLYALDADHAFHGRYSLRLDAPPRRLLRMGTYFAPQCATRTDYVWSAYMRSDTEGARVSFFAPGLRLPASGEHALTSEWRRYHVKLSVPPALNEYTRIWLELQGDAGGSKVWIDAMQVETGSMPGEFEP